MCVWGDISTSIYRSVFPSSRWNFTVGEVQLGLVEGEEEGEELSYLPDQPEWAVQVDTAGGRVYAVKR